MLVFRLNMAASPREKVEMDDCRLCAEIQGGGQTKIWNRPLFESENFLVLPSLGALVEGWLLLLPKTHHVCVGAMTDDLMREMYSIKGTVGSLLEKRYGSITIFEHGPSREGTSVGCGVDHAHLHFTPLSFDLARAVAPFLPNGADWVTAQQEDCRDAFLHGQDYLYLEQPVGKGRLLTASGIGSQLFRRAIAMHLGSPNEFNWRDRPQLHIVMATITSMSTPADTACPRPNRLRPAA